MAGERKAYKIARQISWIVPNRENQITIGGDSSKELEEADNRNEIKENELKNLLSEVRENAEEDEEIVITTRASRHTLEESEEIEEDKSQSTTPKPAATKTVNARSSSSPMKNSTRIESRNTAESDDESEENEAIPELRYYNSSKAFNKQLYALLDELVNKMRIDNHTHIRHIMLYHFEKGWSAAESFCDLIKLYGDDAIGRLNGNIEYVELKEPLKNITFVSATSENHAGEARGLITRLAKDHPTWKILLYDIGLTKQTRKWFENACNVEMKEIDLKHFKANKFLPSCRWKPIIIAKTLKEYPAVIYIDSSTMWGDKIKIEDFLKIANAPNQYLFDSSYHSTFAATEKGMYDYLLPQGNIYQNQFQAGKQLVVRTKSTYELSLKWWVLCAMTDDCIMPKGHKHDCNFNGPKNYAGCHRYDQSAINIILSPYSTSFFGEWTKTYQWTKRDQVAKETPIKCDKTNR